MRPHILLAKNFLVAVVVAGLHAVISFAADDGEVRPYRARIVVPGAAVTSGPGENFYATASLAQGETVEVYRETASGWVGIRPPEGSFSWIAGDDLDLAEGGLAKITRNGVGSRIGTQIGRERNAVQVQLKKGETVEVLGEDEDIVEGATWYKISPPAGEFRWLHASSIERIAPIAADDDKILDETVMTAAATSETAPPAKEPATETKDQPADTTPTPPEKSATPSGGKWQAASSATLDAPPLGTTAQPTATQPTTGEPAKPAATAPTTSPASQQTPSPANADVASQLTAIDLRLSRMAAAPISQWNTERLQRDAEQLLAQAQTAAERESVKSLLAKIDRFGGLSQRYDQAAGVGAAQTAPGQQPITPIAAAGVAPEEAGKYDAIGVLRPVVSKRPGAPQFALVDERGQVVSFVTPTPDMNLQPYVGRRVGVVGNRGYIPEFQRVHVTAGRVQPLLR
jgi:hypothetical protein